MMGVMIGAGAASFFEMLFTDIADTIDWYLQNGAEGVALGVEGQSLYVMNRSTGEYTAFTAGIMLYLPCSLQISQVCGNPTSAGDDPNAGWHFNGVVYYDGGWLGLGIFQHALPERCKGTTCKR
jgi:hypothetical protein